MGKWNKNNCRLLHQHLERRLLDFQHARHLRLLERHRRRRLRYVDQHDAFPPGRGPDLGEAVLGFRGVAGEGQRLRDEGRDGDPPVDDLGAVLEGRGARGVAGIPAEGFRRAGD